MFRDISVHNPTTTNAPLLLLVNAAVAFVAVQSGGVRTNGMTPGAAVSGESGIARPPSASLRLPDEQRLLMKLMSNYDQNIRPVYNITSSVTVNFSLTLVQIMDMVSTTVDLPLSMDLSVTSILSAEHFSRPFLRLNIARSKWLICQGGNDYDF